MEQESSQPDRCRALDGALEGAEAGLAPGAGRKRSCQEPKRERGADQSRFAEGLGVFIVRVFYRQAAVKRLVEGIDRGEGAKAGPQPGVASKNGDTTVPDGQPLGGADVMLGQTRETAREGMPIGHQRQGGQQRAG